MTVMVAQQKGRLKQLSYVPYVQECSAKHEHIKERYDIFKKAQILGMKVIKSEMKIILGGINHQIKITKNQK